MKKNGNMTAAEKMSSLNHVYRLNGIVECLDRGSISPEEAELMKQLKHDSFVLAGRPVSCYASAVLDILGAEEYKGSDIQTKEFIAAYK